MKRFEERSAAYQRRANFFETYILGGFSALVCLLFIAAGIGLVVSGVVAALTRVHH